MLNASATDGGERARARPEVELLLRSARSSRDTQHFDGIAWDIDWTLAEALADLHGLLPRLYRQVLESDRVPAVVRSRLQDAARLSAHRGLLMAAKLLEIVSILESRGIPVIPFKGPTLAWQLYGDVSSRQFGDLDIFVRRPDVANARCALRERGYSGSLPAAAGQQRTFFRCENQLVLQSRDKIRVELHWQVTPRDLAVDFDLEDVWRQARVVSFLGKPIRSLAPEDLLLVLCVHGAEHEWRRIGWIADVAGLIGSHPHLAWDHVRAKASEWGIARIVRLGVRLAVDLLDSRVPADVGQWILADPATASLADRVLRHHHTDRGEPPEPLPRRYFLATVRERWQDKARYVFRATVTPSISDSAILPLPPALTFLYSFVRPVRLPVKAAQHVLNMLRPSRLRAPIRQIAERPPASRPSSRSL